MPPLKVTPVQWSRMIGVVRVTVPVVVMVCPLMIGPMGERPHWSGTRRLDCVFGLLPRDEPGAVVVVAPGLARVDVVVGVGPVTVDVVVEVEVVLVVVDVGAPWALVALAFLAAAASVVDVVDVVVTGGRAAVVLVVVGADLVVRLGLAGAVVVVEATDRGTVLAIVVLETDPVALGAAEASGTPRAAMTPVTRNPVTRAVLKFGPRPAHWRTCIVRFSARIVTICSDLPGLLDRPPGRQAEGRRIPGRGQTGPRYRLHGYCRPRAAATAWSSARKSGGAISASA